MKTSPGGQFSVFESSIFHRHSDTAEMIDLYTTFQNRHFKFQKPKQYEKMEKKKKKKISTIFSKLLCYCHLSDYNFTVVLSTVSGRPLTVLLLASYYWDCQGQSKMFPVLRLLCQGYFEL